MTITTLVENTSVSENYGSEHGLSLYIETDKHKLLFDMGASDLYIKNAQKLGIDLSQVDTAVISHGHNDHGGGLKSFLEINKKAKIYINKTAFDPHYVNRNDVVSYIGLDTSLIQNERIVFTDDYLKPDDELELFSHVTGRELFSLSNKPLLMKHEDGYAEDAFLHEQNLIITQGEKKLLVAGCAHNGIVNITEKYREIKGAYPDTVIGGFHLFNPGTGKSEEPRLITAVANKLKETGSLYYTCHCTGLFAFDFLRKRLGDRIQYISSGSVVKL